MTHTELTIKSDTPSAEWLYQRACIKARREGHCKPPSNPRTPAEENIQGRVFTWLRKRGAR